MVLGAYGIYKTHAILETRPLGATKSTCQVEFYVYMVGQGVGKHMIFASFKYFLIKNHSVKNTSQLILTYFDISSKIVDYLHLTYGNL